MWMLIKREILCFYIKKPAGLLLVFGFMLFVSVSAFLPFMSEQREFMDLVSIIFPIYLFVFLTMSFLVEQFYRDRRNKTFEVLVALGFSRFSVFVAKVLSIIIACYLMYVITLGVGVVIGGFSIPLRVWWNILLFAPLLGFAIIVIEGLLYLIFEDVRVISAVLMIVFFALMYFFKNIVAIFPAIWLLPKYIWAISIVCFAFSFVFAREVLKHITI